MMTMRTAVIAAGLIMALQVSPATAGQTPAPPPPGDVHGEGRREAREQAREQARERIRQARADAERGPWVEVAGVPIVKPIAGTSGDTLEFTNAVGNVVVTGTAGAAGQVVVTPRARGRTDSDARDVLQRLDVTIRQSPGRVELRPVLPPGTRIPVRLDYDITLPEGMGLAIRNLSGDVTLVRIAGEVRVETVAGNLTAEQLHQLRQLRSMSGDIRVSRSTLDGDATLQTVSGHVTASALKAGVLTMESVSGDIRLAESVCDQVIIRTVNGNIAFTSPAVRRGRYDLKTHAGDIDLTPGTGTTGFSFEANTFSGRTRLLLASGAARARDGEALPPSERQVRGTVGDGAAFFVLTSFAGDIRLVTGK
jgi:hypothetical protein